MSPIMTTPPFSAVPPPYIPARFLVTGPGSIFTREELVLCFADFYASLEHVHATPQYVFERLVGNLSMPVRVAADKAGRRAALALEIRGLKEEMALMDAQAPGAQSAAKADEDVRPSTHAPMHLIRSFDSRDGLWDATRTECEKRFIASRTTDEPRIAVCLTAFYISKEDHIIASAWVHSRVDNGFSVSIGSRSDPLNGKLKYASCSWIELDPTDDSIDCGTWSLREDHDWGSPKPSTTGSISFSKHYTDPPQVVLWLKTLCLEKNHNRSIHAYTSNISRSNFTLHIDSLNNQNLYGAVVSWIAFPAGMAGVETGYFESQGSTGDQTLRTGYVEFKQGHFTAPPRVVAGISRFQSGKTQDVHIELKTFDVTKEGMKWRFDGGYDTNIDCAGASFIAIE